MARDTELDLAWVQIKEPGDKKFAYVNLTDGARRQGGPAGRDGVRRMAQVLRPRAGDRREPGGGRDQEAPPALRADAAADEQPGPAGLHPDGKVLGVAVLQMPSDEDEEDSPAAMFSRMSSMQEMMSGMILPAADVVEATQRAKQTAATQPIEEETAAPAKPQGPAGQPQGDDVE